MKYQVQHDRLSVESPHLKLELSCPAGVTFDLAKQLLDHVATMDLAVRRSIEGSKVYAARDVRIQVDNRMPAGTVEFRNEYGAVITAITGLDKPKYSKKAHSDDEEEEG